jgi:antitoxin HicB
MPMVVEELIRYYLALPYRISVVRHDDDATEPWRAAVEELAGCEARGATPAEAVARIPDALAEWVAGAHSAGREIPEPREARQYSGKLLVRMPQSLHAELARAAERDQVSLNAFINSLLAAGMDWRQAPRWRARPAPPADLGSDGGVGTDRDTERRQRLIMIAVAANLVLATVVAVTVLLSAA